MLQPCRTVDHYEKLNEIDEGSYGVVFRARDRQTGEVVALKKVKLCREEEDEVGFPITSLREINLLRCLHHPCIVAVKEVVHGRKQDAVFLVMEYLEHDLRSVMEDMVEPFSQSEVKCLMLQLLDGVAHMHEHWVMHRDLKPANLLLGHGGQLKICDFGLARLYGSPLQAYSPTVVTLWYRAPELLLGAHRYSKAVDVWSVGCIMAELLSKEPLFRGKTEIDQLKAIFGVIGAPADGEWPEGLKPPDLVLGSLGRGGSKLRERFAQVPVAGRPALSARGVDLLSKLLAPNPETRISAGDALKHEWFSEEPLPRSKASMPRLPARRDFESRRRNKRKLDAEEEG